MKLALDIAELRAIVLAVLRDGEVREALRLALVPTVGETHASIASFARRWKVSTRTVRNWAKRGLPLVRFGRLIRIPLLAGDEWVTQQSISTASAEGR